MISEFDKAIIISLAKKIDVNTVFLFGSSLDEKTPANDIDLGVKGIAPINFQILRQTAQAAFKARRCG
jgi:predicted nucleotidyltransferase